MPDSTFSSKKTWCLRESTLGIGRNKPADWDFTRHSLGVTRALSRTDLPPRICRPRGRHIRTLGSIYAEPGVDTHF